MTISGTGLEYVFALAGLGLFLVSIRIMSSNVRNMSSGFALELMKKFANNKWLGLLVGILFTTLIQSSDGTVAFAIGLISAGMLTLRGSIPIILGANIGTATTALVVALGSVTNGALSFIQYVPALTFAAFILLIFFKEENKVNFAMLIFSIGAIFLGLKIMGSGMKEITRKDWFHNMVAGVGFNPWVALVANTGFTGIMQSSSATVTVVQSLYSFGTEGNSHPLILGLPSAIAMVIGANIGTTFTALIASIGVRNRDTKRIAIVWLFTNLFMTMIVMPLIYYYSDLIQIIQPTPKQSMKNANSLLKFQLAWSHLLFNGLLCFVFIWFVRPLEKFAKWVVPKQKNKYRYNLELADNLINESPYLAIGVANNVTKEQGKMSADSVKLILNYFKTKDIKDYKKINNLTELSDITRKSIYAYLAEIGTHDLPKSSATKHMSLVLASRSIERIPILGKEFAKLLYKSYKDKKFEFREIEKKELITLLKIIQKMSYLAYKQLERNSKTRSDQIRELNDSVDYLVSDNSRRYVKSRKEIGFDYLTALKIIGRMAHHNRRVNNYIRRRSKMGDSINISSKLQKEIARELKSIK